VSDHFQSVLDDPSASPSARRKPQEPLASSRKTRSGAYNRAATMIATEDRAKRAKQAIHWLRQACAGLLWTASGNREPRKNRQYDATDRALYNVFHSNMPEDLAGDHEAVLASDMMRRFARGQLPPSMAVKTARAMIQTFGENAHEVADQAAKILRQTA
jgi:hypothetical protein